MQYDHSLKSVSDMTKRLRDMVRQNFPESEIQDERDFLFEKAFGFRLDELVAPLPRTEIERLKRLCFSEISDIAKRNGFDIDAAMNEFSTVVANTPPGERPEVLGYADHVVLPLYEFAELDDGEDDEDVEGDIDEGAEEDEEYYYLDPRDFTLAEWRAMGYEAIGTATKFYLEWIEMIRAKELGLFPTTEEQLRELRQVREGRKFQKAKERERQQPRYCEAEPHRVFGNFEQRRQGNIITTSRKGSKPAREVKVEVVGRRRSMVERKTPGK